jgi:hypothetical protein
MSSGHSVLEVPLHIRKLLDDERPRLHGLHDEVDSFDARNEINALRELSNARPARGRRGNRNPRSRTQPFDTGYDWFAAPRSRVRFATHR